LFAIWQAIHDTGSPESYVERGRNGWPGGNFTTAENEENIETPLKPFNKTASKPVKESDFWKSKDVKQTKTFGYCYPETEKWEITSDKEASRKDIIDKIGVLYPAGSLANIIRKNTKGGTASRKLLASRAETAAQVPLQQLKVERQVEDLAPNNKYLEWITNLKAKKHALGATFSVHVFLGPITQENPILWYTEENRVGAFAVLGQPLDTGCEKCQVDQANNMQVTAQIPLTVALVERYLANRIAGLTPDVVIPYLQENLHWRVTMVSFPLTLPSNHGH
jgi:tyrosinase